MCPPSLGDTTASEAVINAVAAREGVDPMELEMPLYEAIDPDELNTLLRHSTGPRDRSSVEVSFRYHGYDISVSSEAGVTVTTGR